MNDEKIGGQRFRNHTQPRPDVLGSRFYSERHLKSKKQAVKN